jgi:DNA-binding NtrC family response regulator
LPTTSAKLKKFAPAWVTELMIKGKENHSVFFSLSGFISLEDMKRAYISHLLKINKNNKSKTARMLKISLTTLYKKIK